MIARYRARSVTELPPSLPPRAPSAFAALLLPLALLSHTVLSNTGLSNTGLSNTGLSNTGLSSTVLASTAMSITSLSITLAGPAARAGAACTRGAGAPPEAGSEPPAPPAPQGPAELSRRLRERLRELQQVREARRALAAEIARENAATAAAIRELESDRDRLREEVEAAGAEREFLERERARLERRARRWRHLLRRAAATAERVARACRKRVATGVTRDRAGRLATLDAIAERCRSAGERLAALAETGDRASAAAAPDRVSGQPDMGGAEAAFTGVVDLCTYAASELRLLGTRDIRNERVELPGGVLRHAFVARLGLVGEFLVSEDGSWVGVLDGGRWRPAANDEERGVVVTLIEILRRLRAPQLLPVPLPPAVSAPPVAEDEGR